MIRRLLLVLQLPLVLVFALVGSLGIYGSDFDSAAGYLQCLPLLLLLLLNPWLGAPLRRGSLWLQAAVLLTGAALGGMAFAILGGSIRDERSLLQAGLLAALGLVSILAARVGAASMPPSTGLRRRDLAAALALVGLPFLLEYRWPASTLLGTGLAMALGLSLLGRPEEEDLEPRARAGQDAPGICAALLFWLAADASRPIWDYGWDTSWGPLLALTFLAAAVGAQLRRPGTDPVGPWLLPGLAGAVLVPLWPASVLGPLPALLTGLTLGNLLGALLEGPGGEARPERAIRTAPVIALGLVASYQLTLNLQYLPVARLGLLGVPALALAVRWLRNRTASTGTLDAPEPVR